MKTFCTNCSKVITYYSDDQGNVMLPGEYCLDCIMHLMNYSNALFLGNRNFAMNSLKDFVLLGRKCYHLYATFEEVYQKELVGDLDQG